jgi:hypothetical protein
MKANLVDCLNLPARLMFDPFSQGTTKGELHLQPVNIQHGARLPDFAFAELTVARLPARLKCAIIDLLPAKAS